MASCESKSCADCEAVVTRICDSYGSCRGSLIPILHDIQREMGYISSDAMEIVAERLGVTSAQVHSTATFYTLFYTKPQGKNIVRLCDSPPCHIEGSRAVREAISKELGISEGETTEDMNFTFEVVSCMGLCGVAPAIMVNDDVYGNVTPESVAGILNKYREAK